MRIRIYLEPAKGMEEVHLDYIPAGHTSPARVRVCTKEPFELKVTELEKATQVLKAIATAEEDC